MRLSPFGAARVVLGFALATAFLALQALADGSLSVLPNVGVSQAYAAAQQFSMPGGGFLPASGAPTVKGKVAPHNQSGTLTITRIGTDSVRLFASDGLDAFDQTLHVDDKGWVAQSSSPNPFIDALNSVGGILAAAPANAQKDAKWNVNMAAPSWFTSMGAMPDAFSSVPVTVTVVSATGSTVRLHGEGKVEKDVATGMGTQANRLAVTIDCKLRLGQLQSCSRTTGMTVGIGQTTIDIHETTTLSQK